MKIYLLYCGDYDEDGIVGIFSSREKAMEVGLRRCDPTLIPRNSDGKWAYDRVPPTPEQVESRIKEYELDGEGEE
ncbi:MAG: hypothetical protein E7Z65_06305 [Thermoplasmata archaeon]|nr:hypothetical protein [Thermoplasmata archaeon]